MAAPDLPARQCNPPPFVKTALELGGLTLCWFIPSIGLTLLNKWLFNDFEGGFSYPITTTAFHMTMNSVVAHVVLTVMQYFGHAGMPDISWRDYFTLVVPIGLCTGLDVACTNTAFLLLSVSLITIVKSACPFFILLFSFALGLEKIRCNVIMVVVVICSGTALATSHRLADAGVGSNVGFGVLLVLLATLSSGARWATTQKMLQGGLRMDPIICLRLTAPVCAIALFPVAAVMEFDSISKSHFLYDMSVAIQLLGLMFTGLAMAFMLVVSEYAIIKRFSAVTMTLSGVIKELVTIWLGTILYGDQLAPETWAGAFIIILGVLYYSRIKWLQKDENTPQKEGQEGPFVMVGGGDELVRFELEALDDQAFFAPLGAPGEAYFDEEDMTYLPSNISPVSKASPPAKPSVLSKGKQLIQSIASGGARSKNGYAQVGPGDMADDIIGSPPDVQPGHDL